MSVPYALAIPSTLLQVQRNGRLLGFYDGSVKNGLELIWIFAAAPIGRALACFWLGC
jgi:hypothetical protein